MSNTGLDNNCMLNKKKDWIFKKSLFYFYGAITVFSMIILRNFKADLFFENDEKLKVILNNYFEKLFKESLLIQVIIIIAAIVISIYFLKQNNKSEKENENDDNPEKYALSQFLKSFIGVWIFWLLLYIVHLIISIQSLPNTHFLTIFLNPLSNANNLMLVFSYLILAENTISQDSPHWAPWVSLFLFIIGLEIIVRVLFTSSPTVDLCFRWINGIISGASMALFVGRFDSQLLRNRSIYIFFLYFYMAIQAVSPLYLNNYDQHDFLIKFIFSFSTLFFKIILFLFIYELMKENDKGESEMLTYFGELRKIHQEADSEWKRFNEKHEFIIQNGQAEMRTS